MQQHRHPYAIQPGWLKIFAISLIVFLFLAQSGSAALAGQGGATAGLPWQNLPLFGGQVTAIVMDPGSAQTIYAGTMNAGVFKSTDGGTTWQPARSGLSNTPVRSLLASPTQPGTFYAGTEQNGVWKTTNGGTSWSFAGTGIDETLTVYNLVMDPTNANTLYAGVGGSEGHLYKSTNGGGTWEKKEAGITVRPYSTSINSVMSLAIDPAHPNTLYLGTASDGVFVTTNGADSWSAMSTGLPLASSTSYWAVNALAVVPGAANQVAAIYSSQYYVYQSSSWHAVNPDPSVMANSTVGTAFLYYHPTNPNIIYSAGSQFKVSTDGGMTWTQRLGWKDSGEIKAVAFHPSAPDTIYAASVYTFQYSGGVLKTTDQGLHWTLSTQDPIAHNVSSVAVDPTNPQKIFAATGEAGFGSLFHSLDGGQTWSHSKVINYTESGDLFDEINTIAIDPKNPQKVYATAEFHVFTSADGGETFTASDNISFPSSVVVPASGPADVVYASSSFPGNGIFKSTNGGTSWTPINNGLPLNFTSSICAVSHLVADPSNADVLWAATNQSGGMIKTIDGGQHWTVKGLTGHDKITATAMQPGKSDTLLAATSDLSETMELYITTDGGATWNKLRDLPAEVNAIVYDPQHPEWVYLLTNGAGVLQSADGGMHLRDYSTGIFHLSLSSGAFTGGTSPRLLAGGLGSGLYWVQPDLNDLPNRFLYLPAVVR